MTRPGTIARRSFLVGAVAVAGGVAFGYYSWRRPYPNPLRQGLAEDEATFNPYVKIAADDTITIIVPRAEMGQGVHTTLAALVAEELDIGLDQARVEHGPAAPAYANLIAVEEAAPFSRLNQSWIAQMSRDGLAVATKLLGLQITGGSTSTVDAFDRMRMAGASARETLKAAAAEQLGVSASALTTSAGVISHAASGRTLTYGQVAEAAGRRAPVSNVALRPASQWRLLGKPQPRIDMHDKVTGAPIFGIDVTLPEMLFATVRMNPHLGAPMRAIDATAAEKLPGVVKVVQLDTHLGGGFAVIARTTWHAFRAADAVEAEWADAAYPPDEDAIWAKISAAADSGGGWALRDDGDAGAALARAQGEVLGAEYRVPWLAHACMEPMNATAWLRDGRLDIWAPTQVPTLVRDICARAVGVGSQKCSVHVTYLGGGFGRRAEIDFALYAALVAAHTDGRPVKLTWTREEDISHDAYRPASMARCRASLGKDGGPAALDITIATPSIVESLVPRFYPWLFAVGPDTTMVQGAFDQPYDIADYRVRGVRAELPVPAGIWRSVGNSANSFFHESFLDEIAAKGGVDPVAMRLKLMAKWPVAAGVVAKVAAMAGWNTPAPAGHARGIAFCTCFGGWVAEIVEVSGSADAIRLEKVWIAADVGTALDPAIIEAQLISGAVFGLSAAMDQRVTFADGRVEQSNFTDFDALRMRQCPVFEVAILENAAKMGGVGEIATPPPHPRWPMPSMR